MSFADDAFFEDMRKRYAELDLMIQTKRDEILAKLAAIQKLHGERVSREIIFLPRLLLFLKQIQEGIH
mgnify:CR=1 FL=1